MNIICIYKSIIDFFKKESSDFNKFEKIFFPFAVILIISASIYLKDGILPLISAVCGISYTLFNGKGKIYCYFFGIIGTFIYSYLAYKNGFWGNFALYFFYYFPLEIYGIFNWKKYLKKGNLSVKKTKCSKKEAIALYGLSALFSLILFYIFEIFNIPKLNFLDFMCLLLSVLGMFFAVKRYYEQWYIWTLVNIISVSIWLLTYLNGSNCFALVLMWTVYLILGIYFMFQWKKELNLS